MRIQHNIMAMNAYRNYNNSTALSKNLEKLSSGYKINRAGDEEILERWQSKNGVTITNKEDMDIDSLFYDMSRRVSAVSSLEIENQRYVGQSYRKVRSPNIRELEVYSEEVDEE